MFRRLVSLVFLMFLLVSAVRADRKPFTPSQMERYNRLTHELIAPCCWRETIAVHRSEAALQMLAEVQQLVAEGQSEEQIKAMYVNRYGIRILADPPGMEGWWLYVLPVTLFLCLMYLAVRRLRLLVARTASPLPQVTPELLALVRKESGTEW